MQINIFFMVLLFSSSITFCMSRSISSRLRNCCRYFKPASAVVQKRPYFYAAHIVTDTARNKKIILLSDFHEKKIKIKSDWLDGYIVDTTKEQLAYQHQEEILRLLFRIKKENESVDLIVEDSLSNTRLVDLYKKESKIELENYASYCYTPLSKLTQAGIDRNIQTYNVEFRHLDAATKKEIRKLIVKDVSKNLMTQIASYWHMPYLSDNSKKDNFLIDIAIIKSLLKSNSAYSIVAAGGAHIESIAKVLYHKGCTVELIMSDDMPREYEHLYTSYTHHEPITVEALLAPSALNNLSKTILSKLYPWI